MQRVTSGASCVTALMKDGYMVVANAGDCRAVLSRAGTAEALTRDHQAGREDERQRIEMLVSNQYTLHDRDLLHRSLLIVFLIDLSDRQFHGIF